VECVLGSAESVYSGYSPDVSVEGIIFKFLRYHIHNG
jgi:hypothetical protein